MAHRNDVLVVAGSVMNKIAGKYLLKYLEQLMSGTLSNDERDRILRIVASLGAKMILFLTVFICVLSYRTVNITVN
mgnify:CR=1 FL=1|tara:strand:- start:5110 stop:5337 length:228 start_codon:yes stop_codon:yes gene_type:complete